MLVVTGFALPVIPGILNLYSENFLRIRQETSPIILFLALFPLTALVLLIISNINKKNIYFRIAIFFIKSFFEFYFYFNNYYDFKSLS